jgi:hypothetical protein
MMNQDKVQNLFIALLAAGLLVTGAGVYVLSQQVQSLSKITQPKQIDTSSIESRLEALEESRRTDEEALSQMSKLAQDAEQAFSYDENNSLYVNNRENSDLGFSYVLPNNWRSETTTDPTNSSTVLVLTPLIGPEYVGEYQGMGGIALGCVAFVADYPLATYVGEDSMTSILAAPTKLSGSVSPATVATFGGENASKWKEIYVSLGKKTVTILTNFIGDVTNDYQLELQNKVINTCEEIAKTIKAE